MAFTERLRKVKKAAVMAWLAIAGVVAPVKAQTAEVVPEKAAVTAAVEHTDAKKKKQFEAAVRAGAPKEEIAKYIDFPGFIPVTKDGQFDKEKASAWAEKLAPYMKVLAEKGKTMSAADAYKAFKETTGQKDVSLEDFERVCKVAQAAATEYDKRWPKRVAGPIAALILVGLALGAGNLTFKAGRSGIEDIKGKCFGANNDLGDIVGFTFIAGVTALASIGAFRVGETTASAMLTTPEREIRGAYSRMYDTYVDKTIDAQKKQFQQLEWDQVKQALSPQK